MSRKLKLSDWKDLEKKWMKDPKFRHTWQEREPEYQLARSIIKARLNRGLTQAQLAKKIGTKQPVISRLENLDASPSLRFLKQLAKALDVQLQIRFAELG